MADAKKKSTKKAGVKKKTPAIGTFPAMVGGVVSDWPAIGCPNGGIIVLSAQGQRYIAAEDLDGVEKALKDGL